MFRNYLKIAVRNLFRHKTFSFINVFGLALSMSVCLIALSRLKDDFSWDKFHPFPERTFRIITEARNKDGQSFRLASTPLPLATKLISEYTLFEKVVRLYPAQKQKTINNKKELFITPAFTEPGFFDLFGFKLESGDPRTALEAPNSIILTKKTAVKFFGSANPLGQNMAFERLGNFVVTGVLEQSTHKSHIDFEAYASMRSVPLLEKSGILNRNSDNWSDPTAGYTYVLLKEGNSRKQLALALEKIKADLFRQFNITAKGSFSFDIQPLKNITPGEELQFSIGRGTTWGKVLGPLAIVFVILLSACFNYTNLSIARSLNRAKEVGIRKVSGAFRFQVFTQFIIESLLISFLSLAFACLSMKLITELTPFGNEFVPEGLLVDGSLLIIFFLFSVFTGLLAGFLPAWALSSFKPADVLKNLSNIPLLGGSNLRKTLIVSQFSLSLITIVFTLIFSRQFSFMSEADHGFNRKNILNVPLQDADYSRLTNDISRLSGVDRVAATSDNLGRSSSGAMTLKISPDETPVRMEYYNIDHNFIPVMELKLLAGELFSQVPADGKENQVILNEKAIYALRYRSPEEAIGKFVWLDDTTSVAIKGVVKDFHFRGFESPISPLAFRNRVQAFTILSIKSSTTQTGPLIQSIKAIWQKNSTQPFVHRWFEEEFQEWRSASDMVSTLGFLAFITVTIACLGLLGMVIYTTENRRKEIGIRKVMGASVPAIIALISRHFLKLVFIAGCIALPLGYLAGFLFLQIFVIRVSISAQMLVLSFLGMLLISVLTISAQIYKVATANPVKSLRTE
ncbi:MAG: FtsX-like permease family protein [Chitinophagaceae bacterium]